MTKTKEITAISTLGELRSSGYKSRSIKDELRENLIVRLQEGKPVFDGIVGYEETVLPDIERAILSRHNINLLGLRGQAKTRIARLMVNLLDEYIPCLADSEIHDDPFNPISSKGKSIIDEKGDEALISWLHRSERYVEKLATPDVTVADLIGDVDPIKAANLKIDYSDERVIHFGLIPRSHRCIFVINELPDLQPRIQVSLFNILQEGDIQIRGFQLRLPLDIQFVFTANPEDYTNRGAIITPLKDRIQSQILTHYPKSIESSKIITRQEANLSDAQNSNIQIPELICDLVEMIAFEARESEFVDQKSGVSARMSITAFENLLSTAERRMLLNKEKNTTLRISDLLGVIPAITGKVELVYEGEQEGPKNVALRLTALAIRKLFPQTFPDPEMIKRRKIESPYQVILDWFSGNEMELSMDASNEEYAKTIGAINGLKSLVSKYLPNIPKGEHLLWMEFLLHGLSEYSLISKHNLDGTVSFSDLFNTLFAPDDEE